MTVFGKKAIEEITNYAIESDFNPDIVLPCIEKAYIEGCGHGMIISALLLAGEVICHKLVDKLKKKESE